ncbi:MAG: iron-sulfur cluster assembly scaffold protein [Candidatus Caldipriscus sp.]|jgi:nitrogen fixation NifU-like protein|nr:iron-sulfur cluster assembly scaffold protein [Candidatus Caldipriscus sp.]
MDRQLFLDYILDHYHNPRRRGKIEDADVVLKGGNPGCGDVVIIYIKRDGEKLEISFEGEGCTVSQACASIVCEYANGKSAEEILKIDYKFLEENIGEEVLKTRFKCATLALDTLKEAIRGLK